MPPRFLTLWAINGPLDQARLCAQLDQMWALGFDGAVFHPRFFPGRPPYLGREYMALLSHTILYAKSIGMEFWIYDEDGWPSGTVGGQLLRYHPDDVQQWADLVHEEPKAADALGSFEHQRQRWYIARRLGVGVDYLNPNLARHFLSMTHERYRAELDPAAFEYVSTFFSDEPEFGLGHAYDSLSAHGAIPWTPALPALYEQRYGESLAAALPGLFFQVAGYEIARVRFWELLTDIFCDVFVSPVDAWCRSHGKRLAAHVKGEEHPLFQVPTHGSAQQVFRRLSLPGIDALERDLSNDFFPRQLASAARQFGDGRSMVECFGGAGWGATPDEFRRYLLWLGGQGITDFVVHLWQYRLNSHAIRDWPASIPNHIGWAKAFPQMLNELKPQMTAAAKRAGVDRADTLLVSPHRGIMAAFEPAEFLRMNIHDAGTYADTPAGRINDRFMAIVADQQERGVAFHIADERTFEDGEIEGDRFRIGHVSYNRLLLPEDCLLSDRGRRLAAQIHNQFASSPNGTSPAVEIAPPPAGGAEAVRSIEPLVWSIEVPSSNELPLEPGAVDRNGHFKAVFQCDAGLGELSFFFADDVTEVELNGERLQSKQTEDGTALPIPAGKVLAGENAVTFTSRFRQGESQARPMVWIRGGFRLGIAGAPTPGPNGTVLIDGPFVMQPPRAQLGCDVTAAGYPFVRGPFTASTLIDLPAERPVLCFHEIAADAAHIKIGEVDCGFIWGPRWLLTPPGSASVGPQILTLKLYPSAFNIFGPHHHLDGDIHIVSPMQFEGQKNFADRPNAPDHTHVSAWHVKPLRFPKGIAFLNG